MSTMDGDAVDAEVDFVDAPAAAAVNWIAN